MFKQWINFALVCLVVQILSAGCPAFANHYTREAHRKDSYARKEYHRALENSREARHDRRRGHGLRARLHSHHAAHLYKRSRKHAAEARADRYAARHHY